MTMEPVAAAPAQAGKDAAWIAYVLHAVGYLPVMMWPAVVGLIVNYVKRSDARSGLVDSHHGWMIRTFWYGLLWYVLSLGAILLGAWPVLQTILRNAHATGGIVIGWDTIAAIVGAATLGGIGLCATWFWLLYRVIRGAINLSDSRPMP
ncbi:MAG: hypothetical protein A3I63_10175 [Betaproteobacteria bacterium RIFCSPLOWO2_02_FULL_66_14]|nr:MAG: hypothetical protein A3I63_10175 [Betaproteobacteria bacterium RIFCSPLOWO2_02_FULL_66_14]